MRHEVQIQGTCRRYALTVSAPLSAQDGKVKVQWLGQAAFKTTSVLGKVIVIDPWLTNNPKKPEAWR